MRLSLLLLIVSAALALPAVAGTYPLGIGVHSGYDIPAL